MRQSQGDGCPVCGGRRFDPFLEIAAIPVHVGVVWPTAAQARDCPRGDVQLRFCARCGFIANVAFDPERVDYELRYDNALHFSSVFRDYEKALAERLVARYGLHRAHIVEIGCGSGHFLGLLCSLVEGRGVGFDPSHDPATADPLVGDTVQVVRDYYSERYADQPADLVCCRHVLEHLPDPCGFLAGLRRTLERSPETVLHFEVPNAFLALRELSIWDVIYEHCLYFVPDSLAYLFRRSGFEVLDVHEAFGGQFVGLEARPRAGPPPSSASLPSPDLGSLEQLVVRFSEHFRERRDRWRDELASLRAAGRRVVAWGGGAKAVSFLHLLDADGVVDRVVDVNPGKQGSYIAGGGQPIVAPESLCEEAPDVVIVMNPMYFDEIRGQLHRLGISPRVTTA